MALFHWFSVFSLCVLTCTTNAYTKAMPAIQHKRNLAPRSAYQGGWPLALIGSNSPSCPPETSVSCASLTYMDPACCPTGQSCFINSQTSTQYCCPTNVDCNTAVVNFPICANTTWNMFRLESNGYFCCSPGTIGVIDQVKTGGLCEPGDQVVPQTLLATVVSQATATAAAPSAIINATATSGAPLETNPSTAPTSTAGGASSSQSQDPGFQLNTPSIAGISVGGLVIGIIFVAYLVRCRSNTSSVYGRYYGQYPCTRYPEGVYCQRHCCRHGDNYGVGYETGDSNAGGGG